MTSIRRGSSTSSNSSQEIRILQNDDDDIPPPSTSQPAIVIRGIGQLTMFGLNSRFDTEFPSVLTGKVAPEELMATLGRVNALLKRHIGNSARWLLCGLLFCCCSFGCSLWPVVCLNRRTVTAVEKLLEAENTALYHKLFLHWRLATRSSQSSHRLSEYVLLIEIIPKAPLLFPD
ncbi:tag-266 [Pristionchus pacificus]|uniref:Golgin subfamily A member 7/ERF4 domain-containing protein n=1 Tax=Pristionchus pacificus TaxID=54126 RepID=A0A8R1V1C7_PRIPA|nr:tag-266 [Pristionchus pacificus]